jgi:site-specific DNA-methyltransferase (adenine-specific)
MVMFERYEDGAHTIFHGDALYILSSEIASESVDLIFLDPPYNIGKRFSTFYDKWESDEEYAKWAYTWLDECIRILKPNGSLYVMTSTQAMPYKDKNNYTFNSEHIKIEAKTGAQRKLIDYRKAIPTPYNTEKVPGNAWYFPRVRYRMEEYENHPSQKPESLLERIILASSNKGDIVLDPFAGTFTVGAVAKKLERSSISIESQEEYLKIGLRRVLKCQEYKGEPLLSIQKNHIRKNKNGQDLDILQGNLFDANSTA